MMRYKTMYKSPLDLRNYPLPNQLKLLLIRLPSKRLANSRKVNDL